MWRILCSALSESRRGVADVVFFRFGIEIGICGGQIALPEPKRRGGREVCKATGFRRDRLFRRERHPVVLSWPINKG